MGGRNSKRSVDISGTGRDTADDPQPLDGKLEKIEEGAKVAVNGASHSELEIAHDEQLPNGDPVNVPEAVPVEEVAGPSSPSEDAQDESGESQVIQPPKKKEKVKKKWSFRSISFSKKDKNKPCKDDGAKEDTDTVPAVAEEKTEDVPGLMSSVTGALGSAAEAVGEVVVSAEHKVEEGLTATQDQVEKISAKVAEKAEALVVKMEAMTVKAVDSVQGMIGLGDTTKAEVDKVKEAVTDAVETGIALPEVVNPDSTLPEGTTAIVTLLESADSLLPEVSKIDSVLQETVTTTDAVLSEAAKVTSIMQEDVKANVSIPESVTCNVAVPEAVTVITSSDLAVPDPIDIAAAVASEVVSQVNAAVPEMPPPLPASPPPSNPIEDMVTEVINTASRFCGSKDQGESCIVTTNMLAQTIAMHTDAPVAECGDHLPPAPTAELARSFRPSDVSKEPVMETQVTETLVNSVTSSGMPQELENEIEELEAVCEQDALDESAPKGAIEPSVATEDTTKTAAEKVAEE